MTETVSGSPCGRCHCQLVALLDADLEEATGVEDAEEIADRHIDDAEGAERAAHLSYAMGERLERAGECARAAARFIAAAEAAEAAETPDVLIAAILSAAASLRHAGREDEARDLLSLPRGRKVGRSGRARIRAARAKFQLAAGNLEEASRESEKALRLACDSDDDETLADIWEAAAVVGQATDDDVVEQLHAWYQCSGALRELLLDRADDERLRRFAHARLHLSRLHAGNGDCYRAATVLDEAINWFWTLLRPDASGYTLAHDALEHDDPAVASEETCPPLMDLLCDCALARVEELGHVGRSAEAAALADGLDKVLAGYAQTAEVLAQRGALNRALGALLRDVGDCSSALARLRRARRAYRSLAANHENAAAHLLVVDIEIASELSHLGEHAEAVKAFDGAIPLALDAWTGGGERDRLVLALDDYARSLEASSIEGALRCGDAAAALRKAAALRLEDDDADDAERAAAGASLRRAAESLAHQKLYSDAHAELDRAMALLPERGVARVEALQARAKLLEFEERYESAAEAYAAAVEVAASLEGSDAMYLANLLSEWSRVLDRLQRGTEALAAADRALAVWSRFDSQVRRSVWAGVVAAHEARAEALLTLERFGDAGDALAEAAAVCRSEQGKAAQRDGARLLERRAKTLACRGDADGALATHEERVSILRRLAADGNEDDCVAVAGAAVDRAGLLGILGEEEAAAHSFLEAVNLAAEIDAAALLHILDLGATWAIDRGDYGELFDAVVEAIIEIYDTRPGEDIPRDVILYIASSVRALADAGKYDLAAKLVAAAIRHAAPDGRGAEEEFARFLTACRQLTRVQLRNMYKRLPNGGATLRLILGKESS